MPNRALHYPPLQGLRARSNQMRVRYRTQNPHEQRAAGQTAALQLFTPNSYGVVVGVVVAVVVVAVVVTGAGAVVVGEGAGAAADGAKRASCEVSPVTR